MTDFQSEQLDYDRSGDRTRDLKHKCTLTIILRHRSLKMNFIAFAVLNIELMKAVIGKFWKVEKM